jgi:hypothetical protein
VLLHDKIFNPGLSSTPGLKVLHVIASLQTPPSNAEKLNANAPKGQFLATIRNANDVFMIFFVFSRV